MKTIKTLIILAILSTTSLFATEGSVIYKACAGCHGINGEKSALGKSEIINTWDANKIEVALKGYKSGTYGGVMKGVMKGQVSRLDEADIKAVSSFISNLK